MPRTRKRSKATPAKKSATAVEEIAVDEDNPVNQDVNEGVDSELQNKDVQESERMETNEDQGEVENFGNPGAFTVNKSPDKDADKALKAEGEPNVAQDSSIEVSHEQISCNSEKGQTGTDGKPKDEESSKEKSNETDEKQQKQQQKRKEPVILYRPQAIPGVSNKSLIEKWEWHLKFFPIDQADIRSCILEAVSKIAQETWMYIDKQNYGMGSYDLCAKTPNDAAMIMLKTLAMPITYRYLTVEITRRGQNQRELERISKIEEDANEEEEDSVNLPYCEVLEKATLLLDFLHTPSIEKTKGQEKKRCLYVKYLPESTTKEFLKVLFPVANNLDIITTGEGRRVGVLNVSTVPNIFGICNAYVTIHIEKNKTVSLDWHEENIDDGVIDEEAVDELPWEILPRYFEFAYEAVPEMVEDDHVEYAKRRRNLEETLSRHDPKGRERGGDRERRWARERDRDRGRDMEVTSVLQLQHEMNEKINSQIAFLHAVDGVHRSGPSLLGAPPPLMSLMPSGSDPHSHRGRDDRKDGRPERDRRASSGGKRTPERKTRRGTRGGERKRERARERASRWDSDDPARREKERAQPERDRSSGRDREERQRENIKRKPDDRGKVAEAPDQRSRGRIFGDERADRFDSRGMGRFDYPGRGGRFEREPRGGRFEMDERRRFDMEGRGHFEFDGRGRGDMFEPEGRRGQFDHIGRGGRMDDRGQFPQFGGHGGPFEHPEMEMGRGGFGNRGRGRMEDRGRGRMEDRGRSHFEDRGRGKRFDEPSRGGRFDESGRGRHFEGKGRGGFFGKPGPGQFPERTPESKFDNPGGKGPNMKEGPGRGAHFDRRGRGGGNMGRGGFSNPGPQGGMENQGNQRVTGSRGGQGGFGNQPKNPSGDGGSQNRFSEQEVVRAPENQGSRVKKNPGNQQSSFGQQGGIGNQGSYGNQGTVSQNKGMANPQGNMGGYGNQAVNPNSNQSGFGNQQNTSSQAGYGAAQNMNTQNTFGNQANMMSNTGNFGNQQNTYSMNQAGYTNQQGAAMTQGNYGNQQATNTGQGSFNNQQNTYNSQQTNFNNQQNNYGMNQQGAYGNQAYGGYGDNTYNQNYMGTQQGYGNFTTTAGSNTQAWSQNVDYSQYGAANYPTTQTNMGQNSFSTTGGQTQQVQGTAAGGTDTTNTTGYNTQGASGMGYTADASYAAQGYYNTGQADATGNYGTYSTQDATNNYATNATNPSTLATYNFASYNTGSS